MPSRWVDLLSGVARAVVRAGQKSPTGRTARSGQRSGQRSGTRPVPGQPPRPAPGAAGYPGDYTGPLRPAYSPHPDGAPDPGEIVWTWVPYEDDHARGKDRPVLLVGRDGPWLLGLQLTSKDHDRDAAQEARAGRLWMDIGSGPWDARGRASEVRLNRVVRVAPGAVRREGAVMAEPLFRQVVAASAAARR